MEEKEIEKFDQEKKYFQNLKDFLQMEEANFENLKLDLDKKIGIEKKCLYENYLAEKDPLMEMKADAEKNLRLKRNL